MPSSSSLFHLHSLKMKPLAVTSLSLASPSRVLVSCSYHNFESYKIRGFDLAKRKTESGERGSLWGRNIASRWKLSSFPAKLELSSCGSFLLFVFFSLVLCVLWLVSVFLPFVFSLCLFKIQGLKCSFFKVLCVFLCFCSWS